MAKRTIEIEVYQTPDGKPTCRMDPFNWCVMLRAQSLGQNYTCGLTVDAVVYGDSGFIEPSKNCPLWKGGSA